MLVLPGRLTIAPRIAYVIPEWAMVEKLDIPFELPWWTKAYNWFRKWGWVPLGFILVVLAFVCGGALFRRREDGKVLDPLSDIRESIKTNNEQIDAEVEQARQVHVAQVQQIEREHAAELESLNEDQDRRRQELRKEPKKLARWLTGLARGEES